MEIIEFEDGQREEQAYIEIDGVKHYVTPAKYTGKTPLSALVLNKMQKNFIPHKYILKVSQDTALGATVTIPCYYKVGQDVLDVYLNGDRLIKCSTYDDKNTGHYSEVGENDSISNKIKITSDWKAETEDVFDFVVKGEYSA